MALHLVFVVVLGFKTSFCGTEEYQTSGNLPYRIFYYFMAMTGQRFMYYTGWCMSDAGCIACGISYQDLNSSEKSQKESKKPEIEDSTTQTSCNWVYTNSSR